MQEVEKKAYSIVKNIENIATERLRSLSAFARLLLLWEKTGIPTVLFNLECWVGVNKGE